MQLGISTYTYTWAVGVAGQLPVRPLTAFDLIDKCSDMGLSLVQLADNLPLGNYTSTEIATIARYAREKSIKIEPGARGLTAENLEKYISIAEQFASPILRFVIDGPGYEPTIDDIVRIIRPYVSQLKRAGKQLAIENHDRLLCQEFIAILHATDPETVGICLDTVNSMGASEGLKEVVSALAPYTINLHIKDYTIRRIWHKMGFEIEGAPAGQGMLKIPWLMAQLAPYKRCHTALLELWTPPESRIEDTLEKEARWASESIAYLKTLNFD